MGASISVGMETLMTNEPELDGVVIALADLPLITAKVYNRLVEVYQEQAPKAIASTYSNTLGVPALFDCILFPQLLSMMWRNHADYLKTKYWNKRVLWTGSYFIASCGGVTIEQLRKYVEQQDRPSS